MKRDHYQCDFCGVVVTPLQGKREGWRKYKPPTLSRSADCCPVCVDSYHADDPPERPLLDRDELDRVWAGQRAATVPTGAEALVWALVKATADDVGERRASLFDADREDGSPPAAVLVVRGCRPFERAWLKSIFVGFDDEPG